MNFYKCIAFIVVSVMELAIYCVGGQYIVNQVRSCFLQTNLLYNNLFGIQFWHNSPYFQAAAVADAAFDCKWPDKYHKHLWNGLRMVIRRAQTSESITIGNLRTLDLESYKDVGEFHTNSTGLNSTDFAFQALTNSVTYFTILKTLYSADSK